jgi:endonuclease/exonuclease/phosphatase family metal-dependent hydrolase
VRALDVDYLAFSFHKMLAPFGVGVLCGKEHLLAASLPFLYGGDMIAEGRVFPDRVEYNALPWKYAAGTPNTLGTIVSAQALRVLLDLALTPGRPAYLAHVLAARPALAPPRGRGHGPHRGGDRGGPARRCPGPGGVPDRHRRARSGPPAGPPGPDRVRWRCRGQEEATRVRVLTWNLWGRNGDWERRLDAIATVIADAAPDVCGLQEVWDTPDGNLAAELADRLGLGWYWARAHEPRPEDGLSIGNAVLSRWPILAVEEAELPTASMPERRVAVGARIGAPAGALPFVTTHLTYRPGGSTVRLGQVRALAGFVAKQAADCVYPPVVTGDLNAEPDSDEVRLLGGLLTEPAVPDLVLLDAWRYAASGDPGFTWDRRNGYQRHSVIPDSRIDYALVGLPQEDRGRVEAVRLGGDAPVDGVWPSDHFAVIADLSD